MATLYFDGDPAVGSNAWDDPLSWYIDNMATIPAGATPANGDSVYVIGSTAIVSGPAALVSLALLDTSGYTGTVAMDNTIFTSNIAIASGGTLNFSATTVTLTWGGLTADATPIMTFNASADGAILNVSSWSCSTATFVGGSMHAGGTITIATSGSCTFNDSDSECNSDIVLGSLASCLFENGATHAGGTITGDVTINTGAVLNGGTITGDVSADGTGGVSYLATGSIGGNCVCNNGVVIGNAIGTLAIGDGLTLNLASSFGTASTQSVTVGGNLTLTGITSIANANVAITVTGTSTFNDSSTASAGTLTGSGHAYFYGSSSNSGVEIATDITYFYGSSSLSSSGNITGSAQFYNASSMRGGTAASAIFNDVSSFTAGAVTGQFDWTSAGTCFGGTVGGQNVIITPLPGPTISCTPSGGLASSTTSVTLYARGLIQSGATVTFGGVSATSVTVVSSDEITCTTPSGTDGTATIVITNPDTTTITQANGYTYYSSGGGVVLATGMNGGLNG